VGHCFASARCAVASRLAFPAPSSTLAVTDRVLEVFPCFPPHGLACRVASVASGSTGWVPHGLAPRLQSARHIRWNSSQLPKQLRAPPLLGFAHFPPLCRSTFCASTPRGRGLLRVDGATRRPRSALVVSHHLGGFLRAGAAGLLRPAAGCGVRRVARSGFQTARRHPARPSRFPRRISYPSKSSPRQQPHRITAAVAFLPLPHALRARTSSTEAERVQPKSNAACLAGRSRKNWPEHLRGPKPAWLPHVEPTKVGCDVARHTSEEGARGPDNPTTEVAGRLPKKPLAATDRGRYGLHLPPKWRRERRAGALPR